jgi:YndJ-like protein
MNSLKLQAGIGLILWLSLFLVLPSGYRETNWHIKIITLAGLVWLPMALYFLEKKAYIHYSKYLKNSVLCCAIGLCVAMENQSKFAILPYLALTLWIAINSIENWIFLPRELASNTLTIAQLLLPIGSAWATAHCFDFQPLGFDKEIVTLTGVHFHYAGFIFPFLCGVLSLYFDHFLIRVACVLAVLAVPLTAIGITTSHLSQNFWIEAISAATVVLSGYACAISYFIFGLKKRKITFILFAPVLIFSMSLAFLYAIRPWLPIDWLTIPYMKAIHGTCNGILVPLLGFASVYGLERVEQ